MSALDLARKEINSVLKRLEIETGQFVESIEINSVDVTNIDSLAPLYARSVVIVLKPVPGSSWEGT